MQDSCTRLLSTTYYDKTIGQLSTESIYVTSLIPPEFGTSHTGIWFTSWGAEGSIIRGMEILNRLKLRPSYAYGYLSLGEVYALAGQKEKALENLKKGEAMYREMGMDYWPRRVQEDITKLQS